MHPWNIERIWRVATAAFGCLLVALGALIIVGVVMVVR